MTVADTALGPYLGTGEFAPCAELSAVTLSGTNGGVAVVSAVGFFHDAELITDPQPIEFGYVNSVTRESDDSLAVVYGYQSPNWGTTGPADAPVTYSVSGGNLLGEEQIPEQHRGAVRLDLTGA